MKGSTLLGLVVGAFLAGLVALGMWTYRGDAATPEATQVDRISASFEKMRETMQEQWPTYQVFAQEIRTEPKDYRIVFQLVPFAGDQMFRRMPRPEPPAAPEPEIPEGPTSSEETTEAEASTSEEE